LQVKARAKRTSLMTPCHQTKKLHQHFKIQRVKITFLIEILKYAYV
jgi:hypothetical protein